MNKKNIFLILTVISITGCCETTGNPRGGGLFCWSEEKAIIRREDLKKTQNDEESQGNIEKQVSTQLENERSEKSAELEQQEQVLIDLESDIKTIEKKIGQIKNAAHSRQKEKERIENEVKKLKSQIGTLRNDSEPSIQKRKEKIDALNKEIDKLLEIADNL